MKYRFLSFCIVLVLCSALIISAMAVEPSYYMRSGVYYDFMSFSQISFSPIDTNNYVPTNGLNHTNTNDRVYNYQLDYSGFYHCTNYAVSVEIENLTSTPIFKLNGVTGTIKSLQGSKIIVIFNTAGVADLGYLWLQISNVVTNRNSRIALIDVTGVGFTNSTFGNILNGKLSGIISRNYTIGSSSWRFSDNEGWENFEDTPTETITITVAKPSVPHDFISFRFYVSNFHLNQDSGQLHDGTPVVSIGVGTAITINSTAPLPNPTIYTSQTSTVSMSSNGAICYDVTVDVTNANIDNPYYYLSITLLPSNYDVINDTVNYSVQFNGGGVGEYASDSNDMNTFINWYYSYSENKFQGWYDTFTEYMEAILLAINPPVPGASEAQDAIDENKTIEGQAIAEGQEAVQSIVDTTTLPTDVFSAMSLITMVSTWLSSGFGLVLLTCCVLVPLGVGIIMKLLNGGD